MPGTKGGGGKMEGLLYETLQLERMCDINLKKGEE